MSLSIPKHDFLFELGCEELPSQAVLILAQALLDLFKQRLAVLGLEYRTAEVFATPRRLAVYITDLDAEQSSRTTVKLGPAVSAAYDSSGHPTKALLGFAHACGLVDQSVFAQKFVAMPTDKGPRISFTIITPGIATTILLPELIQYCVMHLPIAKPMSWGHGVYQFVRPVHWLLALYGTELLKVTLFGIHSGACSYGHRYHYPQAIKITQPCLYENALKNAYVLVNFAVRKQCIVTQLQQLAAAYNAKVQITESLLDEVTAIVEWPQALVIEFDSKFLQLPEPVLIASMQIHQKCFAMHALDTSALLAMCITIANIISKNSVAVITGNQMVMQARLRDAAFFYAQDRKQSLSSYIAATTKVLYHAKLGSLHDKALRLGALMQYVVIPLKITEAEAALRAVVLSQADLMTSMVGEFPELEGVMGYYYALEDGESHTVALALREQYYPHMAGESLPASIVGYALSLIDRIDRLVGSFIVGQKPSGVKDPFKLRRHALSLARLLLTSQNTLSLEILLQQAWMQFAQQHFIPETLNSASILHELKQFILDRLSSYYHQKAVPHDLVAAVLSVQNDCFYDVDQRIQALQQFTQLPIAQRLINVCKRVTNLLQKNALKFNIQQYTLDHTLFEKDIEHQLFKQIMLFEQCCSEYKAEQSSQYFALLMQLDGLCEIVGDFFEQVMVLVDVDQIRNNRLILLTNLQKILCYVADMQYVIK